MLAYVLTIAVCVEVGIRFLSLPTVTRLFGTSLSPVRPTSAEPDPTLTMAEARAVRLTNAVMRRWPLGSGACLRRSLVVGHFVRRLRPTLRIGVARDAEAINAHAWLEVPGIVDVGRRNHRPFDL